MVFTIRDLECAYNNGKVVLSVPEMNISPGQVMVILGKSGYGKSTFLETIALMNKTIHSGKVLFIPGSHKGLLTIDYEEIWTDNKKEDLSRIRAAYFSFIFQQTNLMPNFSVYENIYITRMIQGVPESICREETSKILDRMGLSGIESNRRVTELSGGQRQRVAFARAVISSFDILFGDEPTGNLDEYNANELLSILKEHIHDQSNPYPKTAIIVTHSIEMAITYADSIAVITKDSDLDCGLMLTSNIFTRQQANGTVHWTNGEKVLSQDEYLEYLKNQYTSN